MPIFNITGCKLTFIQQYANIYILKAIRKHKESKNVVTLQRLTAKNEKANRSVAIFFDRGKSGQRRAFHFLTESCW